MYNNTKMMLGDNLPPTEMEKEILEA